MRSITVLVLALTATLVSGYYMTKDVKYADKEFLVKQKAIFEVLQHVHQHEVHTKLWEDSKSFKINANYDLYTNVEAVKEFWTLYEHGLLPFDEIFTIYNEKHREEVIALFHMFFYAKDWDTFYKSMVWARFHVNEGMFVYAMTVACMHRPDMQGVVLPAIYEIYPYYFFHSEVIQQAQNYKMQGFYGMKKVEDVYSVVIPANYTGWYVHTNPDQKISYFTEDIGLNAYYYYFHIDYPFWMGGKEYGLYKDRRGEFYMYQYQQFLARYYMERLSNDLGVIPEFSMYKPISTGYYPDLRYYNGIAFPSRDNYYMMYTEENLEYIEMFTFYERRIRDAIDYGFIVKPDGSHVDLTKPESVEYLGNLIQGNPDSVNVRFYGYLEYFARSLLSGSFEHFENYKVIPGVMEHFESAMRDPMFYQLYKRVLGYYWQFKNHLPSYTKTELFFQGVKIESVEVDKLVTYFDKFDSDITNAVDVEVFDDDKTESQMKKFGKIAHYQGEDFVIKARQSRLNHLPFTVKMNVYSEKATPCIVKVFVGPKYDQYGNLYTAEKNRENWFELEHFYYELTAGKNMIVRKSEDFSWFVKDRTSYYELYKMIMKAFNGEEKFALDMSEAHCGFPSRLMLPKGKKGGMPFQFFFMVAPFKAPTTERFTGYDQSVSCGVGSGSRYLDSLPFGFPFDREIDHTNWYTPNMYYYDVNIYHKTDKEVNMV